MFAAVLGVREVHEGEVVDGVEFGGCLRGVRRVNDDVILYEGMGMYLIGLYFDESEVLGVQAFVAEFVLEGMQVNGVGVVTFTQICYLGNICDL